MRFRVRKVPTGRRLVASSMASHDYDVILMMSQSSKSSHSQTTTWITYPYGLWTFKHRLKEDTLSNYELIRLTTAEKHQLIREKKHLA